MSEENLEIVRRAIAAFNARDNSAWNELTAADIAVAGETVLGSVERAVAGKDSGVQVGDLRFYGVFEVRDRELVRGDYFLSRDQALDAAGLSE